MLNENIETLKRFVDHLSNPRYHTSDYVVMSSGNDPNSDHDNRLGNITSNVNLTWVANKLAKITWRYKGCNPFSDPKTIWGFLQSEVL